MDPKAERNLKLMKTLDDAWNAGPGSPLGATFSFNRYNEIPHRSFVLYLIPSIVTFGLFSFYWEYVLIQDPNNHFNNHVQFEDALLQSISSHLG